MCAAIVAVHLKRDNTVRYKETNQYRTMSHQRYPKKICLMLMQDNSKKGGKQITDNKHNTKL